MTFLPIHDVCPPARERSPAEQLLDRLDTLDRGDARQEARTFAWKAGEYLDAMIRVHRALEALEQPAEPKPELGHEHDRQAAFDASLLSLRNQVKASLESWPELVGMSAVKCPF